MGTQISFFCWNPSRWCIKSLQGVTCMPGMSASRILVCWPLMLVLRCRLGATFQKKLTDGTMKHIAFLKDPDGYWIEVGAVCVLDWNAAPGNICAASNCNDAVCSGCWHWRWQPQVAEICLHCATRVVIVCDVCCVCRSCHKRHTFDKLALA